MSVRTAASKPSKPSGPEGSSLRMISRSSSISASVVVILHAIGGRYVCGVRYEESDVLVVALLRAHESVGPSQHGARLFQATPRNRCDVALCKGQRLYDRLRPSVGAQRA